MRPLRTVVLLIGIASTALGQVRTRPAIADSSTMQIMARVGSQAGAIWLRNILRRADANYAQTKLDQIADSLTARAIDQRAAELNSGRHKIAVDAINALVSAGSGAPLGGRPYSGALDRLITVHRKGPSRDIRARALGGMLAVASTRSRAIGYLRRVAESSDSTAYDAVEFLITDANGGSWAGARPTASQQQESVSALKALAAAHRVTNLMAGNLLEIWIQRYRSSHP